MTQREDRPLVRTRLESADLAAAWEKNSPDFVAWGPDARSRQLLAISSRPLLRAPSSARTAHARSGLRRGTRLARSQGARSHRRRDRPLAGDAGRRAEADPEIETRLGDAASLPFEDGSFDLVVAFMSLQDIEDFEGAIGEAARVLEPKGRFCMAIVHPLNSAGLFEERADSRSGSGLVPRQPLLRGRARPQRARDHVRERTPSATGVHRGGRERRPADRAAARAGRARPCRAPVAEPTLAAATALPAHPCSEAIAATSR